MLNKISATDAGKDLSGIVNRMAFGGGPIILTDKGKTMAAIVSLEHLQLLQVLEDEADIADAIKAIEEPGENITTEQMRKELGL